MVFVDFSLYLPESVENLTEDVGNDDIPVFTESMLPLTLQFEQQPHFVHGMWCLLQPPGEDTSSLVSCIILKISKTGMQCDVRTVKGKKYEKVGISNIFQPRLDVGRKVEVRYRGRKHFYRGRIRGSIISGGDRLYHILYNDGDEERNIPRELIRICGDDLPKFLAERSKFVANCDKKIQRSQHYHALAKERRTKWGKAWAYEIKLSKSNERIRNAKKKARRILSRPSSSESRPSTSDSNALGSDLGAEVKEGPGIDISPVHDSLLLTATQFTERFDDNDDEVKQNHEGHQTICIYIYIQTIGNSG